METVTEWLASMVVTEEFRWPMAMLGRGPTGGNSLQGRAFLSPDEGVCVAVCLQTADAVVVRDDLTTISAVIALSRRARRIVAAGLIIAATFLTGLVVGDLVGLLPLPRGVAEHEGSTVIVGFPGLRLLSQAT